MNAPTTVAEPSTLLEAMTNNVNNGNKLYDENRTAEALLMWRAAHALYLRSESEPDALQPNEALKMLEMWQYATLMHLKTLARLGGRSRQRRVLHGVLMLSVNRRSILHDRADMVLRGPGGNAEDDARFGRHDF